MDLKQKKWATINVYWKKMISQKEYRKIQAENWKQISLPIKASDKLETLSNNFRYNKKLRRAKTIEAMTWQYDIIKNTERAIVFRDGQFQVIEKMEK